VIAITTYTEPVPLDAVVNDPLKNKENEETEERQSFSEILAGLLQKPQTQEPLVSDSSLDILSAGQINEIGNLELSANTEEIALEDSSDLELSQDFENMLLRADQLFTSSLDTELTGENELALEIDGAEKLLPAEEMYLQSAPIIVETEQGDSAAQLAAAFDAAAKQVDETAELSENRKKANTPVKTDSDETLSAKNKAGEGKETAIAKTDEGKEQPSRLEEFRNRARKDKVTVEVRDYRTNTGSDGTQTKTVSIIETAAGRSHTQTTVHEVTLDLHLPDQVQSQNTWEVKSSNSLENMLARELHQNLNGDIVRHASVALRDGGEGTIKIALHPETLGNVKIHLEMTENKITGRIVVESEEALNAFRKELSTLEQAFKDSGYANADLNLSLTADESGAQDREFDENSFASRMAASFYEDGYDQESTPVINVALRRGSGLVNMFA
jgi:flagellar hook-length control protein FliK